jgi:hypothetical protein
MTQGSGTFHPIVATEESRPISSQTRTVLCDGLGRLEVVLGGGGGGGAVDIVAVDGQPVASDGAGTMYMGSFGFLGDLATLEPMLAIRFRPQTGVGQVLAVGGAAVASAPLVVNKAHWLWSDVDTWIRIGAGAAALDFPLPLRTAVEYIPTALGVDDVISVIQLTGPGSLYIGQSEA